MYNSVPGVSVMASLFLWCLRLPGSECEVTLLKIENRHDVNFVVTGGTGGWPSDNHRYQHQSRWRQSWHRTNVWCRVTMPTFSWLIAPAVTPAVIFMTTASGSNDYKVGIMATLGLRFGRLFHGPWHDHLGCESDWWFGHFLANEGRHYISRVRVD